jgi:hypothetical protein
MTMTLQPLPSSQRKDLQDLSALPRMAVMSYLRKEAAPLAARPKTAGLTPASFPNLSAFASRRILKWIAEYLSRRFGPRHPFLTYAQSDADQGVYRLEGDEIRIALAGDWGTGTDEAEAVAVLIREFKPNYAIHLGDVYYVGGPHEVDENFLGIKNPSNSYQPCLWPDASHGRFALNGNHEMYARGFAYFDRMLPTLGLIANGKSLGQKASFFCLENEYWRIIALDTGYGSIGLPLLEYVFQPSCALQSEQIDWLRKVVRPSPDDKRGIILLTHHQYCSRYDDLYPKPAMQLAEFFSRPVLWFWGHEHRMAIYPEYGLRGGIKAFGRCIGHGGMPVELPPAQPKHPECAVEFVDTRQYPNDENLTIGYNGHAQMSLQRDQMTVDYLDLHGTVIYSESWAVNNGELQRIQYRIGP